MDDVEPYILMLREVLAPLPEDKREYLLWWARHEIATRAIVQWMDDGTYTYQLGSMDPLSQSEVKDERGAVVVPAVPRQIFAMLEWSEVRAVVVYSFATGTLDGKETIAFFRSVVYDPKRVSGPVNHDALFNDLVAFLSGKDPAEVEEEQGGGGGEPPPAPRANGATPRN